MKKQAFVIMAVALTVLFASCAQNSFEMKDGYYSAEAADFDAYGWKEYITIYVSGNKIVTVEYNAYNESGFIKSWDFEYMRVMHKASGTYPNEYARAYALSLINWQDPGKVDAISGATTSHTSFSLLANAAIERAKAGDKHVALVDLE